MKKSLVLFLNILQITLLVVHCYFASFVLFVETPLDIHWVNDLLLSIDQKTTIFSKAPFIKFVLLFLIFLEILLNLRTIKVFFKSIFLYLGLSLFGLTLLFFSNFLFEYKLPLLFNFIGYWCCVIIGFYILRLNLLKAFAFFLLRPYVNSNRLIYRFKTQTFLSFLVNPFRGILVTGNPGSGKTFGVIEPLLYQSAKKNLPGLVYDFKYPNLSSLAYQMNKGFDKNVTADPVNPDFYIFNPQDITRSHRCNPLDKKYIKTLADAREVAVSILFNLNKSWVNKSDDFFVDSSINFVVSALWFLVNYKDGKYCTLGHLILLINKEEGRLIEKLAGVPEIKPMIAPLLDAYEKGANDQLAGQLGSVKLGLSKLIDPQLFWLTSTEDFSLDLNDPKEPKVLCLASNPQNEGGNAVILGLLVNRIAQRMNQPNRSNSFLLFDEMSSLYIHQLDRFLATARSNKIATVLGLQDISQLQRDYGSKQAEVMFNMMGNIISGAVRGESAEKLVKTVGKRSNGISAERISNLGQGELLMVFADREGLSPLEKVHCDKIIVDPKIKKYKADQSIPVINLNEEGKEISDGDWKLIIKEYFKQIQNDVDSIFGTS